MIVYPLAWPTHKGLRDIVIRRHKIVGASRSPFSILSEQFYEWPGNERWAADINLPPMLRADAEPWIAWLLSLDGPIGTFLMGDPNGAAPRGLGTGVPQVDGTGQSGKELAIKTGLGVTANWLRAGDWVQVGSTTSARLYKNLRDVSLSASGRAVLDIRPKLRAATVDGEAVTVFGAKGLWRLEGDTVEHAIDAARHYRATMITAVEASAG